MNAYKSFTQRDIKTKGIEYIMSKAFSICEKNNELGINIYFEEHSTEITFNNAPCQDSPFATESWDVVTCDNFDGIPANRVEWSYAPDSLFSILEDCKEELPETIEIVSAY